MIKWLSSWGQGIIVAVTVSAIIEMLLPNGNSKKYVRVVIGIYILFTIISPVISKLPNGKIDVNEILDTSKYEKQIVQSNENISKKIEASNSRTIKDIYISNLEKDIKVKLEEKGYGVSATSIEVKEDGNYTIEKINLSIYKTSKDDKKSNSIMINSIEIAVGKGSNTIEENNGDMINDNEKNKIKEYLSATYDIDSKKIEIS